MRQRMVLTLVAAAVLFVAAPMAGADLINPGFDGQSMAGWTTVGQTGSRVLGAWVPLPNPDNNYWAHIGSWNGAAVSVEQLNTFLGIPLGSLEAAAGDTLVGGGAIYQDVFIDAGSGLSFDWGMYSPETTTANRTPRPDEGFLVLAPLSDPGNAVVISLIDAVSLADGNHEFDSFSQLITASDTYRVGFASINAYDSYVNSILLVDNVHITPPTLQQPNVIPEPSTFVLLSTALLGIALRKARAYSRYA